MSLCHVAGVSLLPNVLGISRSQLGVLLVASSFQVGEGILGVNLECS